MGLSNICLLPLQFMSTWNLWIWPCLEIVFVDAVKLRWDHTRLGKPESMALVLMQRKIWTQRDIREENTMWSQKWRLKQHTYKPKNTKDSWQPPGSRKKRKDSSLEHSEGAQLRWHLDFGHQAFRTTGMWISVVLNYQVCGTVLQQP